MKYDVVLIGGSLGTFKALGQILPSIPADFPLPLILVVHRHKYSDEQFEHQLSTFSNLRVQPAKQYQVIEKGTIYVAPSNYHLLIEENFTFSFTLERQVNFARPSIDVTFESAANVYKEKAIGIILSGANKDGSSGLKKIMAVGGFSIVQSPETSVDATMTEVAIKVANPDKVLPLNQIGSFLDDMMKDKTNMEGA